MTRSFLVPCDGPNRSTETVHVGTSGEHFEAPGRPYQARGMTVLSVDILECEGDESICYFLVVLQDKSHGQRTQVMFVDSHAPASGTCQTVKLPGLTRQNMPPAIAAKWQNNNGFRNRDLPLRAGWLHEDGIIVYTYRWVGRGHGHCGLEDACPEARLNAPHAQKIKEGLVRRSASCCFAWTNDVGLGAGPGLAAFWGEKVILYKCDAEVWTVEREISLAFLGEHRPILQLAAFQSEKGCNGGGLVITVAAETAFRDTNPAFLEASLEKSSGPESESGLPEEVISEDGMTIIGKKPLTGAEVPSMFLLDMNQGAETSEMHASCALLQGLCGRRTESHVLDLEFLPHPDIVASKRGCIFISSTLGNCQVTLVAPQHTACPGEKPGPTGIVNGKTWERSLRVIKKFYLCPPLSVGGPSQRLRIRSLKVLEAGHALNPSESTKSDSASFLVQLEKRDTPPVGQFFNVEASTGSSELCCSWYRFQSPWSRNRETRSGVLDAETAEAPASHLQPLEDKVMARIDSLESALCGAISVLSSTVNARLDSLEAAVKELTPTSYGTSAVELGLS